MAGSGCALIDKYARSKRHSTPGGGIAACSAGQWVESAYFAREHPEGRVGQVVQILKVAPGMLVSARLGWSAVVCQGV